MKKIITTIILGAGLVLSVSISSQDASAATKNNRVTTNTPGFYKKGANIYFNGDEYFKSKNYNLNGQTLHFSLRDFLK